MSADFWAGYISGAVGIIIGNPLDVLKVKLQAGVVSSSPSVPRPTLTTAATNGTTSSLPSHTIPTTSSSTRSTSYLRPFLTGTAAPVLGYGALNALLFVSYNRTEAFLNQALLQVHPTSTSLSATTGSNLYTTWLAGAVGGLATWVVSTPTELIKCRVQLASSSSSPSHQSSPRTSVSSWSTTKQILRSQGIKGLYFGGLVTALRDSIGYGFYFWSYELTSRWMASTITPGSEGAADTARVLLCGGLAGIVTWASIFPLDVIKTRVQTQVLHSHSPPSPLLAAAAAAASSSSANRLESEPLLLKHHTAAGVQEEKRRPLGAWEVAKQTYTQGGIRPFFRGLGVCSVRAFIVNAVQWAVYEWIMAELGVGRNRNGNQGVSAGSTGLSSASTTGGEIVL
ncbi:Mitochondrial carrier domain containing protein [Rhypophila decipiens]